MDEMDEFERELQRALQRVEAPAGFVERVIGASQAKAAKPGRVLAWPRQIPWLSGALAAGLLLGAMTGRGWYERRQSERRAVAAAQFDVAMRLTGEALETTERNIKRSGVWLKLN